MTNTLGNIDLTWQPIPTLHFDKHVKTNPTRIAMHKLTLGLHSIKT